MGKCENVSPNFKTYCTIYATIVHIVYFRQLIPSSTFEHHCIVNLYVMDQIAKTIQKVPDAPKCSGTLRDAPNIM